MESNSCEYEVGVFPEHNNNANVGMDSANVSVSGKGGWAAAIAIIVNEFGNRMAYHCVSSNSITYMTDVLHMGTAVSDVVTNVWSGTTLLFPLLGAFISDSYLGCYWTVFYSDLIFLMGSVLLTLSAFPSFGPPPCGTRPEPCPGASAVQLGWFFASIMLVAVGVGGHKACLQTFGANQFGSNNPNQARRSSFFNWSNFAVNIGLVSSSTVFVYIQENISWVLGYGIPTIIMTTTFCIYLSGSSTYRHSAPKSNPFIQIHRVLTASFQKRRLSASSQKDYSALVIQDSRLEQPLLSNPSRFPYKGKILEDEECTEWKACTEAEEAEVKHILRLIPIWISTLMYGVIYYQSQSSFVKQGKAMNRKFGSKFEVPSAALQTALSLTVALFLPFYDRVFVPLARKITGNVRGITMLQRISIGLVFSTLSMIVAAMVEMMRLRLIQELRLENVGSEDTAPMHIAWLLPQYILLGLAYIFALIGMEEFFYDQMPLSLKSFGAAMYLGTAGVGGILGGVIVAMVDKLSSLCGYNSWFDDNMNRAHFDYFYWLLAALSALFFYLFLLAAKGFRCNTGIRVFQLS